MLSGLRTDTPRMLIDGIVTKMRNVCSFEVPLTSIIHIIIISMSYALCMHSVTPNSIQPVTNYSINGLMTFRKVLLSCHLILTVCKECIHYTL